MSKDCSSSIKQNNEKKLKMLKTTISNLFVKGRNENLIPKEEPLRFSQLTVGGTKTSIKKSRRFLSSDFTNMPKFSHEICTIQFDSNMSKRQCIKRKRNERCNTYYIDQRKSYETTTKYQTNMMRSYNAVPLLRSTQGRNADRRREEIISQNTCKEDPVIKRMSITIRQANVCLNSQPIKLKKNADIWEITSKDSKTYNDNIDESKSITATTNFNEQDLIPEESNEVNAREITNTSEDYNPHSARPSIKQNIHLMKAKELVVKTKREVEIQNSRTLFQYQTTQDCLDDEEITLFLADNDAKVEQSSFGLTELIERTEDLSQFDWSINLNF